MMRNACIALALSCLFAACSLPESRPVPASEVAAPAPAQKQAPPPPQEYKPAPMPMALFTPLAPSAPAPQALAARRPPPTHWPPPADTAKYPGFADNPWQRIAESPVSTFAANVDTGAYANLRRFLNRGQLPPRDAVRVEELLNYFGYEDPPPAADAAQPFAVTLQLARSPWSAERGLLRIGIKGRNPAQTTLPPANLVFLVDVSGSMGPPDRLPLLRAALGLLVGQLRAQDRVSLVSYANGTQLVLPATPGDQHETIRAAIARLQAAGGTHGEAGIRLAYEQARAGFIPGGINRVLLATDGDLNIGVTDPAQLKELVDGERRRGIALSTLGVGDHNYNDALMKKLANAGDGSYHYLDSLQEAHKVLVQQMRATLGRIAQDLKLQIEFNPAVADEYRLIGYELSALRREDFNNDQVDAGDIGAGHSVSALYEWVPRGAKGNVDPLRYAKPQPPAAGSAELAWLKLRYKLPGRADSELVQLPVRLPSSLAPIAEAPTDLRFAAAIAGWGQWLRASTQIGSYSGEQALALAQGARGADAYGHRAEAEWLMVLLLAVVLSSLSACAADPGARRAARPASRPGALPGSRG